MVGDPDRAMLYVLAAWTGYRRGEGETCGPETRKPLPEQGFGVDCQDMSEVHPRGFEPLTFGSVGRAIFSCLTGANQGKEVASSELTTRYENNHFRLRRCTSGSNTGKSGTDLRNPQI